MAFFFSSLMVVGATLLAPMTAIYTEYAQPVLEVSSQESLLDQEVTIKLFKLHPHENDIKIQAQTTDDLGVLWTSFGVFQANDLGEIDLSKLAPASGSYEGIDPIGLLWSMQPPAFEIGASFKIKKDSFSVMMRAYRGKEEIASREITRLRKDPHVKKVSIQENGLRGILFLPPSEKPLPVILTLSGSNGGFGENRAQLLASHGFAVFALGYFGVEGLPLNLQEIPLEYFETAFTWLKKQPGIDSSRIGIYGASRGAELALILGSLFPQSVQAVVAVVPNGVNQALSLPGPSLIVAHGGVHWALCCLMGIEDHEWAIDNCVPVHFLIGTHGKWMAKKL